MTIRRALAVGAVISVGCWGLPAQPRAGARRFTLSGTVVDGASDRPLSSVQLTLNTEGWKPVVDPTVSDSQGRFAFSGLAAGEYILSAEGSGFGTINFGEAPDPGWVSAIRVGGESGDKSVVFRIVPRASIEGAVHDEFGDPMVRANIALVRSVWRDGRVNTFTVAGKGTDDRGRYRFGNLMPGSYTVCLGGVASAPAPLEGPVDFATRLDNRYYARSCSKAFQLAPGQRAQVDLSPVTATAATVRGRVRNLPPQTGFNAYLTPEDENAGFGPLSGFADVSKGEFTIRGVPAGRYRLHVQTGPGGPAASKPLSADMPLEVGGSDVDGVDVAVDAGASIDVTVASDVTGLGVNLRSANSSLMDRIRGAVRDADGHFHFDMVTPGAYRLDIRTPAEACVQSVKLGQNDVTGKRFELNAGTTLHFDVALAARCGTVQVRALRDGQPVPGAKVVLLRSGTPKDPGGMTEDFANDEGKFLFSGLAPGRYLVWAWALSGPGAMAGPASLEAVQQQATTVEVTGTDTVTVDVPLLAEGSGQ